MEGFKDDEIVVVVDVLAKAVFKPQAAMNMSHRPLPNLIFFGLRGTTQPKIERGGKTSEPRAGLKTNQPHGTEGGIKVKVSFLVEKPVS
jgi:hypothetical protein